MEKYYAITRSADSSDELQHFKYIKREKAKNGKWRYIYDRDQELTKYKNGTKIIDKSISDDGTQNTIETRYKQTDNWFDSHEKTTINGRGTWYAPGGTVAEITKYHDEITTKSQGKISRAIAKGEKWIFDNLISNEKKYPSQRNKKKK